MHASIDQLDVHLLTLLQKDSRASWVELAKQLGVSDTTVRTRVEQLVRRVGLKFVVDLDPADLGLLFLYVGARVQGPTMSKVIERVKRLPELVCVNRTTGGYDLLCEVVCRDRDDLARVLDELRAIPGIVHMDTFSVLRVEKEDWQYGAFAAGPSVRSAS